MEKPLQVFCCYAREDQALLLKLKKHLKPLQRDGLIIVQTDIDVSPGEEWEQKISHYLETAQIILLLISSDFMDSDYCYSKEIVRAMERHKCGEACVIPIILRFTSWHGAPFGKLQALPTNAEPVTSRIWQTTDEAFLDVTKGIEKSVEELVRKKKHQSKQEINEPERETSKKQDSYKKVRLGTNRDVFSRTRWYKDLPFKRVIVSLLIFLIISTFTYWQLRPQQAPCAQRTTNLHGCGSGLGISNTLISGKEYTIGLNGDFQHQFDPTSTDEKMIEGLILSQNNDAEKWEHFTIILATTLSKSTSDQYTGLEELRGALLAQQAYNRNHTIKMRLLVANLGVRAIAEQSVSVVARQIALYAANAPQNDHFLGVTGFPFSLTLKYGLQTLQDNQIPVVGSSPSDDQFSHSLGFHRVESPNSQQVKYLFTFIQNILRPQKIMILYDSSDNFSTNLASNLTVPPNNPPNVAQTSSYIGGDVNSLNRAIETIVSINPDLLIFTGFPADLNTLKTTMIQGGHRIPRILGSQTLYELGAYTQPKPGLPSNYANLMFSSFAFPDDNTASAKEFQHAYASVFDPDHKFSGTYGKGRAGSHAALSYDAMLALQNAVDNRSENGTIPSMAMVSNALNTLPFFTGATGSIEFSPSSSDPDPRTCPLDILCTNHEAQTQLIVKYYPDHTQKVSDLSICN